MSKKLITIILISYVVIIGVGVYGGMKYGQSKSPVSNFARQNFQDLSPEQREQFSQGNIGENLQKGVGRGVGAGFLNGEVIAKDEQSLTLKIPDGGSKIIFFSDSTEISKTTDGSITDIDIGKQITVSGQQNSDGSYTAETIQLSPRYLAP